MWICAGASLAAAGLFIVCANLVGEQTTLAPPLMDWLLLTAGGGGAATLVLLALRRRRWRDKLFLLLLPLLLLPMAQGAFMIPVGNITHARLSDGRVIHLAYGPELTDVTYQLWQEERGGWWWRRLPADLSYSEDGRFSDEARLGLSRDGRRLLVGRGGIWTDCLEVGTFRPCPLSLANTAWSDPDFEARMRANSAVIGAVQ
jgi:hypothetical protein